MTNKEILLKHLDGIFLSKITIERILDAMKEIENHDNKDNKLP